MLEIPIQIRKYLGASTDSKPTSVPVGSTFYEYNTGDTYISYDGTNWAKIPMIYTGFGFRVPVYTTTQRDALTATTGLVIYNSTTAQLESYNGSAWVAAGKVYGDATFLPLGGGQMSGNITMAGAQTVDGIDISVHAADVAAHQDTMSRHIATGVYHFFNSGRQGPNIAMVADTLYAIPIVIPRALTVDRIGVAVQVAGAGGKLIRIGIYNNGTNYVPGTLLADYGTVAADTTGVQALTISQALAKRVYWLVIISNGTPTVRTVSPVNFWPIGSDPTDWSLEYTHYTKVSAFGALPDPFPSSLSTSYAAVFKVMLRVLSLT